MRAALLTSNGVMLAGISSILKEQDLEVSRAETIEDLNSGDYDLIFFDMETLGSLPIIAATKELRAIKVVLGVVDVELGFQCIRLGIRGIIPNYISASEFMKMFLTVTSGEMAYEKKFSDAVLKKRRVKVSPRESQLILLLSQGLPNKEIAYRLKISEGTVKVYLTRLFDKLKVSNRYELGLLGIKNLGFVQAATMSAETDGRILDIVLIDEGPIAA